MGNCRYDRRSLEGAVTSVIPPAPVLSFCSLSAVAANQSPPDLAGDDAVRLLSGQLPQCTRRIYQKPPGVLSRAWWGGVVRGSGNCGHVNMAGGSLCCSSSVLQT